MALLDLLRFALACFDALAWPLFALLYPLYSSIRAIETNSIADTYKLNSYWVVFSLILLFEHAFTKLLEWFLLWPYIRLLIVFLLVMPHFDGALYVYKHLIFPCLSMDPQTVINLLSRRKESIVRDNFLSEAERYIKENGTEGVENVIACKSKSINPNGGHNIKAVQVLAEKKEATASQVSQVETNLTVNEDELSSRKMNDKAIEVAVDREVLKTQAPKKVPKELITVSPRPTQMYATFNSSLSDKKHKATYEALKIKNEAEPKLTCTENRTDAAMEIYERLVKGGASLEDLESPQVQKEWSCALCQVSTSCEENLISHLIGKKHKEAYEALKARNQAFVPKITYASTAKTSNQPIKKPGTSTPSSGSKQKVTVNEKVQGQKNRGPAPITKKHHKPKEELAEGVSSYAQKGKFAIHVEKVQSQQPKPNEVQRVKSSCLRCAICNIKCTSEVDMVSHLKGRKHKEIVQERQAKQGFKEE